MRYWGLTSGAIMETEPVTLEAISADLIELLRIVKGIEARLNDVEAKFSSSPFGRFLRK